MKRKPIVGEDNDEEDEVDAEMQHVCQELKVEHIDSLQSNMGSMKAAIRLAQKMFGSNGQ